MPLYEYKCEWCDHRFEVLGKRTWERHSECPKCGHISARVISAPAIHFKGEGWTKKGE